VTLFRMPDGSSVVFYAYLHEAFFTEDPRETEAARAIFTRFHDCSIAATA
jgi:hypothetical protein